MGYQTGLPAALAARGLQVEVVDGWKTRGSSTFNPKGAVCHWTAGAQTGDRPSLRVVTQGHGTLPGPLCNVFLSRGGVAVVVAAGRANHAGTGGWRGLTGNHSVFGTEAESTGGGDWTDAQRWAYPRINAAFCDLGGFGPDMVCGHNEWAPNRKIDIRDWDMPRMRREVSAVLEGDDDMPLTDADVQRIVQGVLGYRNPNLEKDKGADVYGLLRAARDGAVASIAANKKLDGVVIDARDGVIEGRQLAAQISGLDDAITEKVTAAVLAGPASGVDPEAIRQTVRSAVRGALADIPEEDA